MNDCCDPPDGSGPPAGASWPGLTSPSGPGRRRGRPLNPISPEVRTAHRAWLEPAREAYVASGLTMEQLGSQIPLARSKVSELLSGKMFPRWELLHAVAVLLNLPLTPLQQLWRQAALEASKSGAWTDASVAGTTITYAVPPLDHRAFKDLTQDGYRLYAGAFLLGETCEAALTNTFDRLWLSWRQALASANTRRYAWQILRSTVMSRAAHIHGRPLLEDAAFNTVVLQSMKDLEARMEQLTETMALFEAVSRLPDNQLDVMVLRSLRGMSSVEVADLTGVLPATVMSDERHAARSLRLALCPPPDTEGDLA